MVDRPAETRYSTGEGTVNAVERLLAAIAKIEALRDERGYLTPTEHAQIDHVRAALIRLVMDDPFRLGKERGHN